ncbi:anaerobic magnesium-protoporphyrin IX monomethyl ester cyclase [Methanosarcinales archaeon]|nr:anaerobic magnesium-protoporphyrin IX monomethyl ester cyclase [Methanosarcinales archaeon]
MTSVLLIYPYFNNPHNRSSFRFPPLGLGYVAASLRNAGYGVDILDCTFMKREEALKKAQGIEADVVGIYSMVTMRNDSIWFAKNLRDSCDLLIAGGPLPSCDPLSFMNDFDVVVKGEGEHTMLELLRAYDNGCDLRSIPGIVYRKRNNGRAKGKQSEIVFTDPRILESDLDKIAFPARDLFPNDRYIEYWKRRYGHAATTVFTTRGCPFSCEFCSNAVFGISYRERSPENVVDEVEHALSFGYDRIHFADDVFTLNRERVLKICDEIRRRGLHFKWECLGRVDSIDEEISIAMKDAGCDRIFFGIESGNDSVLKLMKKKITPDRARKAVYSAHEAGLSTGAFFILCYPGETDDTVLETLRFAVSLPLDYLSFTMPYPLPGTALYERVKERVSKEWKAPDSLISDHVLIFDADFSENKMKLAILKGEALFEMKKRFGNYSFLVMRPFELLTSFMFRLMK